MPANHSPFSRLNRALKRHVAALGYVLRVVVPVILRTRRRPVIFSRYTGMGDIICTLPAAQALKLRHPGAPFIYNCHPDFAAVPRLAGLTQHVTTFLDVGVVDHWYHWLLGGFYHFAHGDDTPGQSAQEPMVAEFCRQFNLPVTTAHPQLTVPADVHQRVRQLLAKKNLNADALVLIHPGPSWTVKEWPHEHWSKLVSELRARGYTNVAQLGVGRYMNFGQVAVAGVPNTVSLVDALSVEECVATIAQAKLFIGIDSGLLHIAACTRTPSVAMWGPTSPQFFYAPEVRKDFVVSTVNCVGCYHRLPRLHWITNCPHEIQCMKQISVDEVLSACVNRLNSGVK